MSDFKSRLIDEKQQLDEKITKLSNFQSSESFQTIPVQQQTLLNIQVLAMATYSQVLTERIALLN